MRPSLPQRENPAQRTGWRPAEVAGG